jgi:hypothetical protein
MMLSSGLLDALVEKGLLLPHEELIGVEGLQAGVVRVLRPRQLPFYSFPYEWSFEQLKDAALLTLRVLRIALKRGMTLKDASAFNISFIGARPVFTDILSLTRHEEGSPWRGYLQFCEQFLVPLLLSRRAGRSVSTLLRSWHDGVPLTVGSRLLRGWTSVRPSQFLHVHLHARSIRRSMHSERIAGGERRQSLQQTLALVDGLERMSRNARAPQVESAWDHYYEDTVYDETDTAQKESVVREWVRRLSPSMVWDLGSNTGRYARIAAEEGIPTFAMDADEAVVDAMYRDARERKDDMLTPLVMNLANPSPALGFAHDERPSLADRGPADLVLYLGLVHHMRFPHMVPLQKQAAFLARIARNVLFEWIPPEDPNVSRIRSGGVRENFPYSRELLLAALDPYFELLEAVTLGASGREMLVLKSRTLA